MPKKLAQLNAKILPMDMLELDNAELSNPDFHSKGVLEIRPAHHAGGGNHKRDPRLYAIYLSNFSCGPDSFLLTFFKDFMGQKPCLQLELDEHSADAGVITRLEAFFESLKHYKPEKVFGTAAGCDLVTGRRSLTQCGAGSRRTIYIPWMGDSAYGLAACI